MAAVLALDMCCAPALRPSSGGPTTPVLPLLPVDAALVPAVVDPDPAVVDPLEVATEPLLAVEEVDVVALVPEELEAEALDPVDSVPVELALLPAVVLAVLVPVPVAALVGRGQRLASKLGGTHTPPWQPSPPTRQSLSAWQAWHEAVVLELHEASRPAHTASTPKRKTWERSMRRAPTRTGKSASAAPNHASTARFARPRGPWGAAPPRRGR